MIFSENRNPPRIKSGAGSFGIMLRPPVAPARSGRYMLPRQNPIRWNEIMRAETQADVEAIKQSIGLLRRHL
jgi:hypothetical protein